MQGIFKTALIVSMLAPAGLFSSATGALAQDCGTYIIAGCYKDWNSAERQRRRIGAPLVVDTNDYPNFRNGWFCAADGPYDSGWEEELNYYKYRTDGRAVRDAYAKEACD
ncbi:hypothetical protein CSC94_08745 [Zhengella mangrovi]|uniref:YARHG domain-containing protein n=1 Tax=Zhengella mangrovi TaxID=1982044 RepID=A0A2G1QQN2_9HYPH|nr:hypothetical protein [Zhengella mangrovi]PHP67764.1 hypothetical protein CSC94_08745 [Zhengella mangrovi]